MVNPKKFRRLTRAEASRLGKSYGAKHQVDASLKRVTKSTKTYTNRKAAELRTGAKREAYAKANVERRNLKSGGIATEFRNLTKQNLFKKLRKYRDHEVLLKFHAAPGAKFAEYKGKDITELYEDHELWFSGVRVDAETLLDDEDFEKYLRHSDVAGALKYGLIVY